MGGLTASPHTSSHEMFALRVTAAVSVQPDQTGPGAVLQLCGPREAQAYQLHGSSSGSPSGAAGCSYAPR